jgi:hypothetical protein
MARQGSLSEPSAKAKVRSLRWCCDIRERPSQVHAGKTGIGSVKVSNQVAVMATVSGSTAGLTGVIDLSLLGGGRFAPGRGHQPPAAG